MHKVDVSPIKTAKLLLRSFSNNDLENVFKGLSDPDVVRYYGISYATLESTKEQMQFFSDLESNNTGRWWAICSLDNKTFYGAAGLNNISLQHKKGELGFWLLPEFWGKGIIAEAIPVICKYGYENIGLHRIEAFVESENVNCKKAMSKLSFLHEGTMEDCEIKNDGLISLDIYAQIKR